MPNFRLDGKKALVTGAGRGLGKAIADDLAESGATVYGTSRDAATARQISERYGTPPLAVDLSSSGNISGFAESLHQRQRRD